MGAGTKSISNDLEQRRRIGNYEASAPDLKKLLGGRIVTHARLQTVRGSDLEATGAYQDNLNVNSLKNFSGRICP